mmetsp:Transcript_19550/g.32901  ORF Transcript_19550/g.32901 Transcript_19550/m.32901 type:complete len:280 (+) Transcript_19550:92-931(+)
MIRVYFAFVVLIVSIQRHATANGSPNHGDNRLTLDLRPSSEPTLSPTHSSSVELHYQQDLVGISPDEFSSHMSCSDIFRATVAAILGASTEASAVKVSMVTEVPGSSVGQVRVQYSSTFDFIGDHDQFLDIADECNQAFVASVESGNFTSELQRLAVDSGKSLLYNVTSSSVIMLDFDHLYNSMSPTDAPSEGPGAVQFYERSWFTLAINVVVICAVTGIIFAIGFYWKATAHHIHSICVEPPDDKYVESSSESDTEAADDAVYQFKVDPNICDVDDMY